RCAWIPRVLVMVLDSFCRCRSDFQKRVKAVGGESELFVTDDMSPFDRGSLRSAQIQRYPLAPSAGVQRTSMDLQAAYAKELAARQTAYMISGFYFAT